mmetsp:Transcript_24292/g.60668  ORF Transcript_24292/g.60668 Transcript_24292/m.60668 type:complete len:270 (-) Transcript_24292:212-1021(-)
MCLYIRRFVHRTCLMLCKVYARPWNGNPDPLLSGHVCLEDSSLVDCTVDGEAHDHQPNSLGHPVLKWRCIDVLQQSTYVQVWGGRQEADVRSAAMRAIAYRPSMLQLPLELESAFLPRLRDEDGHLGSDASVLECPAHTWQLRICSCHFLDHLVVHLIHVGASIRRRNHEAPGRESLTDNRHETLEVVPSDAPIVCADIAVHQPCATVAPVLLLPFQSPPLDPTPHEVEPFGCTHWASLLLLLLLRCPDSRSFGHRWPYRRCLGCGRRA